MRQGHDLTSFPVNQKSHDCVLSCGHCSPSLYRSTSKTKPVPEIMRVCVCVWWLCVAYKLKILWCMPEPTGLVVVCQPHTHPDFWAHHRFTWQRQQPFSFGCTAFKSELLQSRTKCKLEKKKTKLNKVLLFAELLLIEPELEGLLSALICQSWEVQQRNKFFQTPPRNLMFSIDSSLCVGALHQHWLRINWWKFNLSIWHAPLDYVSSLDGWTAGRGGGGGDGKQPVLFMCPFKQTPQRWCH